MLEGKLGEKKQGGGGEQMVPNTMLTNGEKR